jgi:hypothetical protein
MTGVLLVGSPPAVSGLMVVSCLDSRVGEGQHSGNTRVETLEEMMDRHDDQEFDHLEAGAKSRQAQCAVKLVKEKTALNRMAASIRAQQLRLRSNSRGITYMQDQALRHDDCEVSNEKESCEMALGVRLTSMWYDLGVFCSHGFVFRVGWIRESYDCAASTVTETQPASQGTRNQ